MSLDSETAELEQLITPIDKMVLRCLKQNKNGITMMDIVNRIQFKVEEDHGNLEQAVCRVLENAIKLGFIEKSKFDKPYCSCKGGKSRRRRRRGQGRSWGRARGRGRGRARGRGRGRSRSSSRRTRSRSAVRRRRRCIRRRRLRPRRI